MFVWLDILFCHSNIGKMFQLPLLEVDLFPSFDMLVNLSIEYNCRVGAHILCIQQEASRYLVDTSKPRNIEVGKSRQTDGQTDIIMACLYLHIEKLQTGPT